MKKNQGIHSEEIQKRVESLIAHEGLAGYGLYWVLIDLLSRSGNALEYDPKVLAYKTAAAAELLHSVCLGFGLFRVVGGVLCSVELSELNEIKNEKSAKARASVRSRWDKKAKTYENDTNVSFFDTNVLTVLFIKHLEEFRNFKDNIVYTTSSSLSLEDKNHGIVYQKRRKEKIYKKEKKRKEIDPECYEFAQWFLTLLPREIAERVKEHELENWADVYDKLRRIDKRSREEIIAVVRYGRTSWWSQNFLSPLKLRRNDPNGTPYYTVFYNQMKSSNANTTIEQRHHEREQFFDLED